MLLAEFCKKNDVPYDMIKNMIIDERDLSKYSRRKNIFIRLDKHLDNQLKQSHADS